MLHNGFLHPPVLCLHLSHTPVTNSSLRENEEPLIGFEGISSRIDRGEANTLASRPRPLHGNKYPRAPHLFKGGKTWGFINCNPPSAHSVFVIEADLLVPVIHNSSSLSGHVDRGARMLHPLLMSCPGHHSYCGADGSQLLHTLTPNSRKSLPSSPDRPSSETHQTVSSLLCLQENLSRGECDVNLWHAYMCMCVHMCHVVYLHR